MKDELQADIEGADERRRQAQGTLAAYWMGVADGLRQAQRYVRREASRRAYEDVVTHTKDRAR